MYRIVNYDISDEPRAVYKHKKFDRYYVRGFPDFSDDLELFTTMDLNIATEVLDLTNNYWNNFKIEEIH